MGTVEAPPVQPAEADPVVLRRIFPAEVTAAGAVYTNVLVCVTRERVWAWQMSGGKPALVLSAAYTREPDAPPLPREFQLRHQPIVLATEAGQVTVNRGRGCGCGNPLKSFRPFVPERRADQ